MKQFLLSGLVAVASLATVVPAQAGRTFGLFVGCGRCCNRCCGVFCVRQYNAFTPVCSGCITCDGCMPFCCGMPGFACGGYGCGMCQRPGMGGWGCCPSCPGPMCSMGSPSMGYPMESEGTCCMDDMPGVPVEQGGPMPAPPSTKPMPMAPAQPVLPAPAPGAAQSYAQPYQARYPIQPVGYYPAYGYNPSYGYNNAPAMPNYGMMNYWFPMGQVPYYWSPMGGR